MVPDELLVEGGRRDPGPVLRLRPVPRGIRCEDLVDQKNFPVSLPELELRVAENDPLGFCEFRAARVDLEAALDQNLRGLFPDEILHLRTRDVDIVTVGRLGCGGEDRVRKFRGLFQTLRQRDAADRAGFLVVLPARPGQVSPDDAFDRKGFCFLRQRGATAQEVGVPTALLRHRSRIRRDQMVRRGAPAEPELGQKVEDGSLVRNSVRQDDIERGDPVGRDNEELVSQVVHLPDFAAGQVLEAGKLGTKQGGEARHCLSISSRRFGRQTEAHLRGGGGSIVHQPSWLAA